MDDSPPATFCKIMAVKPTQELKDMGYDFSKMVFYVEDGAIAEEVWDVMLYQLLENSPDRQKLYNAKVSGDTQTKTEMQGQYLLETCSALLKHVDSTLDELSELYTLMDREGNNGYHKNLPMIRYHNDLVTQTFLKVKNRLDQMVATETVQRQQAVQ